MNTHAAIQNLSIAFIAGPIVFVLLSGACVLGWRLNARRHAEIRRALEEREATFDAGRQAASAAAGARPIHT